MKFLLLALFLAVGAVTAQPTNLGNPIDDLVRSALEYVRYILKNNEPLLLPQIPAINITDDTNKIYLTTNFTELYVSDADQFNVTSLNNNVIQMTADFSVFLPTLDITGNYVVSGTAFDKDVSGSGDFSLSIQSLNINGHVQLELVDGYVQMKSLTIDYTVDGVQFSEEGLVVEGMTQQQIDDIFNTALLKFVQDNEQEVCTNVANYVIKYANGLMKGKSLIDIINWLKNIIQQ